MPQQTIDIPNNPEAPEMAPAMYLAILAYPGTGDAAERGTFLMALRAKYFEFLASDSERQWRPRAIEPALLKVPKDMIGRAHGNGVRRIRDRRLVAARMAATVLHHDAAGAKVSVSEVASLVAESFGDVDGGNIPNVLSRQWGDSKPVLHLALALRDAVISRSDPDDDYPLHDLLDRPEWIESAVPAAEIIRQYLVKSPLFRGVNDDKTVRVVLI